MSRKFQSGHPVYGPRFELKASRIGRTIIRTRPVSEYKHEMHDTDSFVNVGTHFIGIRCTKSTSSKIHTVWPQHLHSIS